MTSAKIRYMRSEYAKIDAIISDMEAYRRLIDALMGNNDRQMEEKENLMFNEYINQFNHFYKDDILEEEPVMDSNLDMSDSNAVINTKMDENEKELATVLETEGN